MKYITVFLLLIPLSATAQWRNIGWGDPDGLSDVSVALAFGVQDHHIFVSSRDVIPAIGRILREDSPYHWVPADTGIDFTQGQITSFASLGRYLFVGQTESNGSIAGGYRSSDDGTSWLHGHNGSKVATNGTYVFSMGIYPLRSRDSGNTLEQMNCPPATGFVASGSCILAATTSGIYRSTDSGTNWSPISAPSDLSLKAFAVVETHFFAGDTSKGIYRSDDSGSNWTQISVSNRSVNALAAANGYLFAGTDSGVFILDTGSMFWRNVSDNMGAQPGYNPNVKLLTVVDSLLYAYVITGDFTSYPDFAYGYVTARPISEMTSNEAVASIPPVTDTIEVFPNPASEIVTIRSTRSIVGIHVLNVLGTEVRRLPGVRESALTLDLSKLPSGTYFLEIQTAKGTVLRKVVRE